MTLQISTETPVSSTIQYTTSNAYDSPKKIEGKIAAIDANQIEGIAQKIVEKILDCYGFDANKSHITGEAFTVGEDGTRKHMGYVSEPDPKWKPSLARLGLSGLLLPLVKNELTQAFSTPVGFLENGHYFTLTNDSQPTGILAQVAEKADLSKCRFFQYFSLKLSINTKHTQERADLYFSFDHAGHGKNQYDVAIGNTGFYLKNIESK